ncbi:Uncharacterised protein [Vibrio cholerae]|nr:Uncharacterised protein [Vibrio cholerae]
MVTACRENKGKSFIVQLFQSLFRKFAQLMVRGE